MLVEVTSALQARRERSLSIHFEAFIILFHLMQTAELSSESVSYPLVSVTHWNNLLCTQKSNFSRKMMFYISGVVPFGLEDA